MQNCYGVVYKITNIVNNKIYIGQTIQDIEDRVYRHFYDAYYDRDTVFCRAVRKYGKENFTWEIIDTAMSFEELNEKEIFWIDHFNSYVNAENSAGYNMKLGGKEGKGLVAELNPNSKLNRNKISEILTLAKTGKYTLPMISKEFELTSSPLQKLFKPDSTWHSVVLELVSPDELKLIKEQLNKVNRKASSGSLEGLPNYGHKKKEKHHYWGKRGKDVPNSKPVLQIDLATGEILREFESASDAARYVNACNGSKISMVCRGERNKAYGYKWAYKKVS